MTLKTLEPTFFSSKNNNERPNSRSQQQNARLPRSSKAFSWNVSNYCHQPLRKTVWCRSTSKWQAADTSVLMVNDTHAHKHTPHRAPLAPALINTADLLSWQLSAMFEADWPCNLLVDVWLSCHISATNATPSHKLTQHWHVSVLSSLSTAV